MGWKKQKFYFTLSFSRILLGEKHVCHITRFAHHSLRYKLYKTSLIEYPDTLHSLVVLVQHSLIEIHC